VKRSTQVLAIGILAIAFAAAAGCDRGAPPATASASGAEDQGGAAGGGKPADVGYADLEGIREALAARRGHPVFLNFWATWCAPCIEELPELGRLARDYDGGPRFVGVSLDAWVTGSGRETEDRVRGALRHAGIDYDNLIYNGDQDMLLEGFNLPGSIPYSILYDGQGRPVATWDGQVETATVRKEIDALH